MRRVHDVPIDDVTKLFFDSFSGRVAEVEKNAQSIGDEFRRLKRSIEQGHISDLVLLERLQDVEQRLEECLEWIVRVADVAVALKTGSKLETEASSSRHNQGVVESATNLSRFQPVKLVSPSGEVGSIQSLTTSTELGVLALLDEEGPKSAPEIGKHVGRSREHTARLMKKLLDEGYVLRDQSRIPYRYSLSERVRQGMAKQKTEAEVQEEASSPPA